MKFSRSDPLGSIKRSLREIRRSGHLEVHERVDLKAWTALRIGGSAELVLSCHCISALQEVLDLLAAHGTSWLLLGSGSYLVPADEGLNRPVVRLTGELARWRFDRDLLTAGGGANMTPIVHSMAHAGMAHGIFPAVESGTIGGMLKAESRRSSRPVTRRLRWIEIVRPGNECTRTMPVEQESLAEILLGGRAVVAGVCLSGAVRDADPQTRVDLRDRKIPHPRQVRGIFFALEANPVEELLRRSGCDGMSVGGAWMGGDIVNSIGVSRSCSAGDVIDLVRRVRDEVKAETGVELATCLRFIDRDGRRLVP